MANLMAELSFSLNELFLGRRLMVGPARFSFKPPVLEPFSDFKGEASKVCCIC